MQLFTKESETKSRIDEPAQMQISVGSDALIVYFNVSREISGDVVGKALDNGMPLMIPVDLIFDALQTIYQKALELRAIQIAAGDTFVKIKPNYKDFYGELLTTELFAIVRQKAAENLQVNTAYTDFALALTNGVVGNENASALQVCLDKMIEVLGINVQAEHLEVLDNLLLKHSLPVSRDNTTN